MTTKQNGGASATNEYKASPIGIYYNALDFVMNSLALDEDAAAKVILNELGGYANEWQKLDIQSAVKEIKRTRYPVIKINWGRAWLN